MSGICMSVSDKNKHCIPMPDAQIMTDNLYKYCKSFVWFSLMLSSDAIHFRTRDSVSISLFSSVFVCGCVSFVYFVSSFIVLGFIRVSWFCINESMELVVHCLHFRNHFSHSNDCSSIFRSFFYCCHYSEYFRLAFPIPYSFCFIHSNLTYNSGPLMFYIVFSVCNTLDRIVYKQNVQQCLYIGR